jgi:chaperone modulatory protein CbpM
MIRIDAVIARFGSLDESQIADWIARGWVHAEGASPAEWRFTEIDVARLHLVRELRVDLALDEESMPLVLSLLDQVYSLRRALRTVMEIINEAPETTGVRGRILAALTREP